MKYPLRLFICAMMIGVAMAQEPSASQVDIRRPDLTISNGVSKTSAVIAYSPNGRFLAVAGKDNAIRLYDIGSGDRLTTELTQTLTGHTAAIIAIGFNGTNTLVSISADRTAKMWDVASGKFVRSVTLNFGKQLVVAIAPGTQPLLAAGAQRQVNLWNYQTGERLKTFEVNDSDVATLAFTPDGKLVVIGTFKGVVRVMDVATWKVIRSIDLDSPVYSLAASMSQVALGYGDGTVALLDLKGERDSVPERKEQAGKINALAFSANGSRFASASADGSVKIWDAETLKLVTSLGGHSNEVLSVVVSPNGQRVASGSTDGLVRCWTVP